MEWNQAGNRLGDLEAEDFFRSDPKFKAYQVIGEKGILGSPSKEAWKSSKASQHLTPPTKQPMKEAIGEVEVVVGEKLASPSEKGMEDVGIGLGDIKDDLKEKVV